MTFEPPTEAEVPQLGVTC